jgi:hypothetical protein
MSETFAISALAWAALCSVALTTMLLASLHAQAQLNAEVFDLPPTVAIQDRTYIMGQGFHLSAGYLPVDSFNRGFTVSAAFRYPVTPHLLWEVLQYQHVFNQETQLKGDLRALPLPVGVRNVGFGGVLDYPRQTFLSGVYFTPLYSKGLFLNSILSYSETSLYLGAGTLNFNSTGHKFTVAPGFLLRYFLSPRSTFTVFFRTPIFHDDNLGYQTIFDFGVGWERAFQLVGEL